ncbi:GNAT family N-acetyltransferase [Tenacibaculum sp. M341]|uniref:GNAT family N-acetyltransferase n=1 Tax=Tenacibaculum sp. M341 TaxID=2530339 RepID=UPI001047F6F6|nr:GNAT family N-acetyltransferase [Tenacibaculum sp. M341]TCI92249.1 N-acetyltransferase [Tenacibaculum sp. M341]
MYKATKDDKAIVAKILCSAFEPILIPNSINFVVKQDHKRSKRMKVLMEYLFDTTLLYGDVFLSNSKTTCVLIQYPHKKKMNFTHVLSDLKLAFQCIGLSNVLKVLKREKSLRKHHLKQPHIHPIIFATLPSEQNKGQGSMLINELIKLFEGNKLPVIIETTLDENIRLYQKFGFEIIKKTKDLNYPLIFLKKEM